MILFRYQYHNSTQRVYQHSFISLIFLETNLKHFQLEMLPLQDVQCGNRFQLIFSVILSRREKKLRNDETLVALQISAHEFVARQWKLFVLCKLELLCGENKNGDRPCCSYKMKDRIFEEFRICFEHVLGFFSLYLLGEYKILIFITQVGYFKKFLHICGFHHFLSTTPNLRQFIEIQITEQNVCTARN